MTQTPCNPLRKSNENTARTIGIIVFSIFVFSLSLFPRNYEIQFHTIRLQNKIDYEFLKNIGVTKLVYRVFQDEEKEGGLYFINSEFKTLEPALEKLIEEFDFNKLNLCAWMITRKFNWISDTSLMDYEYDSGSRRPIRKLDIFNPDAIAKIISVFKELVAHRIGYILIQDDLILRYNEGFSSWGKTSFSNAAQVPAVEKLMMEKNTGYYYTWNRVKISQVSKVLKLIVESCKKVNPSIKIGINVYYEAPVFEARAAAWYAHNLKEIAESGVDYIYLMSYQRQIKDEMKFTEDENRAFFKDLVEKAFQVCKEKLVVKLQVRDWKTSLRVPADELSAYLALIPPGVERVCFTPLMPDDLDYLKEVIDSDPVNSRDDRFPMNNISPVGGKR